MLLHWSRNTLVKMVPKLWKHILQTNRIGVGQINEYNQHNVIINDVGNKLKIHPTVLLWTIGTSRLKNWSQAGDKHGYIRQRQK